MAKWKLSRQTFGNDVFEFAEGDKVTVGRGVNNTISLSSIVISRNHCIIDVKKDEVSITDLKSSNGIYVGLKRIPANVPYVLAEADVIGFGWTVGAPLAKIKDDEQYVFKLEKCLSPITHRIQFQDNALDDIEAEIASFDAIKTSPKTKLQLKRKLNIKFENDEISKEVLDVPLIHNDVIDIVSDSDNETYAKQECAAKKIKFEPDLEDEIIKCENEDFQYEAFNVKQEYMGYNDEPIEINSDSDSESEHWFRRLSQSSPGKSLKNDITEKKTDTQPEDGSYSQLDDAFDIIDDVFEIADEVNEEEEFIDDLITIPSEPPANQLSNEENSNLLPKEIPPVILKKPITLIPDTNIIKKVEKADTPDSVQKNIYTKNTTTEEVEYELSSDILDLIDGISPNTDYINIKENNLQQNNNRITKKTQMIEPPYKTTKRKSHAASVKKDVSYNKSKSSHKSTKTKRESSPPKKKITNSQKEERKKKLKQIACKDRDVEESIKDLASNASKGVVNVKVTTSNRGAFLTDVDHATVKPSKRKNSTKKGKEINTTGLLQYESKITSVKSNISNKCDEPVAEQLQQTKPRSEQIETKIESISKSHTFGVVASLKPLRDSEKSFWGKPVSKVEPLPQKLKKSVTFSDAPPEIHEFEIETGNRMRKTCLVKTTLVYVQKRQIFSLEKTTLITILRWNPHWLDEQMKIAGPPPILGHRNTPSTIFHSFPSHKEYVKVFSDLLLMEIWECITQAYNRTCKQHNELQFRIESCPLEPPAQERHIQLSNMNVNVSLPVSESKRLPRIGDILILEFGPENDRCSRFVFVHSMRQLPSPPNNKNSFFTISLNVTFTEKMRLLKPGEVITGRPLAYIKNELTLFEAIEYLAGSPLNRAILRPDTQHYPKLKINDQINLDSPWTKELNCSQKLAVSNSVTAALGDRPGIQMVQGPPGTGKSGVICAIVMTYFYDASGKKQQNRGKILICATSNAAVDELVIRLLKIRQSLPKSERFGMVRVGRLEAMHERAADVSSQRLAQRDVERAHGDAGHSAASDEIAHLDAKINMWKAAKREAKNPERVAYCQGRVSNLQSRLALLRSASGNSTAPVAAERLMQVEQRTIEGADIIVTTLASSQNYKMRGLKSRIALCIVDEAGQAIEPETLIPLTLDVTRLTLIGDPQQLPGYICSQRAKKYGLGESLFSRLTSCSEQWAESPVVLLDHQYRMHPAIAEYPNRAFYNGRVLSVHVRDPEFEGPPYLVLGIMSGDKGQGASGANETEAWGVARLAAALAQQARARHLTIAVITPYCAHRDLLREALRTLQAPSEARVEVNTVDSFQGQERDVVLVSLARSRGVGFLTETGRMNVMLTRARQQLFVCLNPSAVVKNNQWQTLVDDARNRKVYKTLPTKFCQPPSTSSEPSENILSYLYKR